MTIRINKMKRFGYPNPLIKGLPKPKSWEQIFPAYEKKKIYIYKVKSITLEFGKIGPGQSSARYFHYYELPPLIYWNPDILFKQIKYKKIDIPKITIEYEDGNIKSFPIVKEMKSSDILKKTLELCPKISNNSIN